MLTQRLIRPSHCLRGLVVLLVAAPLALAGAGCLSEGELGVEDERHAVVAEEDLAVTVDGVDNTLVGDLAKKPDGVGVLTGERYCCSFPRRDWCEAAEWRLYPANPTFCSFNPTFGHWDLHYWEW